MKRPSPSVLPAAIVLAVLASPVAWAWAGPQTQTPPRPVAALSLAQVRNATIAGVYDKPVTLKDGLYEGPPFAPGGASRPTLRLLSDLVRFGDLDGAPGEEAAVLLSENSGGSGEMIYAAVVGRRGAGAASLGTALVGDRTKIRTFTVSGATIIMDVVEAGPNDPMCCPTQLARKVYRQQGGRLVSQSSTVTGTLSIATLAGDWTAVEIDGKALPAGAKPPTATFDASGAGIAGFGGCNRYTGTVKEESPGQVTIGPIAGTRMACPGPDSDVESRYLAALGKATRYTFLAGKLLLTGPDGDALREVLFVRR